MRDVILRALDLAKAIAAATPTTVDDKIIATIDSILANEAILDILVDLIDRWISGPDLVARTASSLSEAETAEIDKAGFGIAEILMIAKIIMDLIAAWRNR